MPFVSRFSTILAACTLRFSARSQHSPHLTCKARSIHLIDEKKKMNACWSSHYSSPPPERELYIDGEHRSRRDMSPQGRKRAALMISRDQPASIGSGYQTYRKASVFEDTRLNILKLEL